MLLLLSLLLQGIHFADSAPQAGLDFKNSTGSADKAALLDTMSGGVAWIDFDQDGRQDLYFVNGGTWEDLRIGKRSVSNALYRNRGDGTFENVTESAGVPGRHWGLGVTVADFDNDGWPDLYLSNYGPNTLYHNNGDGTFRDVSEKAGLDEGGWSSFAASADYDGDGLLDLYVVNYVIYDFEKSHQRTCSYRALKVHCGPRGLPGAPDHLYRNRGDGTFLEVSQSAGVAAEPSYGLGAVWADLDNDGDQDLYVANDSMANFLFLNQGDGTFRESGLLGGAAFSEDGNPQAGMGVAVGDYDNDGLLDLFVTHFSDDYNTLYRNLGKGLFRDSSYSADIAFSSRQLVGWGAGFLDYDNDGLLDLFAANGHVYPQVDDFAIGTRYLQPKILYRNLGNGSFEVAAHGSDDLTRPTAARGAAFSDFDDDGDVDIAVNNLDDRPQLLVNQQGNRRGKWMSFRLQGTRSNRDAIGARITLQSGQWRRIQEVQASASFQSSNDLGVHFGLGDRERVERVVVRWPSGLVQTFQQVEAGRRYFLKEGEGELRTDR